MMILAQDMLQRSLCSLRYRVSRYRQHKQGYAAKACASTIVLCFCVVIYAIGSLPANAQSSANETFILTAAGLASRDFVDFTTKAPADTTIATTASLTVDAAHIRIHFHAEQPIRIIADQTVNDVGFGLDDYVEIGLDANADANRVYFFAVNPKCTRYERLNEDARYRPFWTAKCAISRSSWDAWLNIPLSALRMPQSSIQRWRVNFIRHVAATGDDYSWAFQPEMASTTDSHMWPILKVHLPRQAQTVRTIKLYGLATSGKSENAFPQPNGSVIRRSGNTAGIDFVQPLTPTLNLVGTVNPDFSNVEHDEDTILPQEFPRQIVDYRPFFAEGANFIDPAVRVSLESSADRLFYSPSIGDFDNGMKIEGTAGHTSIGILDVNSFLKRDTAYGFSFNNTLDTFHVFFDGVSAQHEGISDATNEFGFTFRNRERGLIASAEIARENGSRVANEAQAANLFALGGLYTGTLQLELGFRDVGPQYNPIDGFTAKNDIRGPILYAYYEHDTTGALKSWNLYGLFDRYTNTIGISDESDVRIRAQANTAQLLTLTAGINTSTLTRYRTGFPLYLQPSSNWYNQSFVSIGYHQNTASPVILSYSLGVFGQYFTQSTAVTVARQLARTTNASIDLEQTDQQGVGHIRHATLFRVSVLQGITRNMELTASYRTTANETPFEASNISLGLQGHFRNGDEAYVSFGSPSTTNTLDRFLVKYVRAIP